MRGGATGPSGESTQGKGLVGERAGGGGGRGPGAEEGGGGLGATHAQLQRVHQRICNHRGRHTHWVELGHREIHKREPRVGTKALLRPRYMPSMYVSTYVLVMSPDASSPVCHTVPHRQPHTQTPALMHTNDVYTEGDPAPRARRRHG